MKKKINIIITWIRKKEIYELSGSMGSHICLYRSCSWINKNAQKLYCV